VFTKMTGVSLSETAFIMDRSTGAVSLSPSKIPLYLPHHAYHTRLLVYS
jgi:hypothetical protein